MAVVTALTSVEGKAVVLEVSQVEKMAAAWEYMLAARWVYSLVANMAEWSGLISEPHTADNLAAWWDDGKVEHSVCYLAFALAVEKAAMMAAKRVEILVVSKV